LLDWCKKMLNMIAQGATWAVMLCAFLASSSFIKTTLQALASGSGDPICITCAVVLGVAWAVLVGLLQLEDKGE